MTDAELFLIVADGHGTKHQGKRAQRRCSSFLNSNRKLARAQREVRKVAHSGGSLDQGAPVCLDEARQVAVLEKAQRPKTGRRLER